MPNTRHEARAKVRLEWSLFGLLISVFQILLIGGVAVALGLFLQWVTEWVITSG